MNDNYGYVLAAQPGPAAGAASYNVGLAAHVVRTVYPSCILPKAPGPVTHASGSLLPDRGFQRDLHARHDERLHQGIGYVTPAERHDGRHVAIIEARRRGLQEAKERRRMEIYGGVRETR